MNMNLYYSTNRVLRVAACACLLAVAGYAKAGAEILAAGMMEAAKDDPCFFRETVKKGEVIEHTHVTNRGCKEGEEGCMLDGFNTVKPEGDLIGSSYTSLEGGCSKLTFKIKASPTQENYRLYVNSKVYRRDDEKSGYYQAWGEWPQDEYTLHIPKPDLPYPWNSVELRKRGPSYELIVSCNKDPRDEKVGSLTHDFIAKKTKTYIEKVKAKGFTVGAKLLDGMPPVEQVDYAGSVLPVAYSAKNSKGYFVRVLVDKNMCFVTLKNPAAMDEEKKMEELSRKGGEEH